MDSDDKYQRLFETMEQGVIFHDTDGKVLSANPAAQEMLGLSFAQIQEVCAPGCCWNAIHEDGSDYIVETHPSILALNTGMPVRDRIMGVLIPGTPDYRWLKVSSIPQFLYGESSPYFVLTTFTDVTDITERKRADTLIKKQRDFIETVLDTIGALVVVMNDKGEIIRFNRACEQLTGYRFGEVRGRHVWDFLLLPDEAKGVKEVFHKLRAGHFPNTHENCWVTRTGEARDIAWSNSALVNDDGSVESIIATGIDITERKQAEEELAEYQENLEELVEERTREVKAINRELEAFSYSVSHDLRAPLRSIEGFSQALEEEYESLLDERGLNYLRRVRTGVKRMGHLIDDLLNLSRITRSEMHMGVVDMSRIAQQIIEHLSEVEPEREVDFVIQPDITTRGDIKMLRIALENLLGNAWKFTTKQPRAHIEFGRKLIEGKETCFVQDNGAGFDMAYKDKLFGPFQRLHSNTDFEGTGIGLATVQRIIQRHGGSIWASSEPDKGTTFFFRLNQNIRALPQHEEAAVT